MGILDHMREQMEQQEIHERQRRQKDAEEARQRYRPEPGCRPLRTLRCGSCAFAAAGWAAYIGLGFINNEGLRNRYVALVYLSLVIPPLLLTRAWICLMFAGGGEMTVKEYRQSVGLCGGSLKAAAVLWALAAVAEGVFFIVVRPSAWLQEAAFLLGTIAAAVMTHAFDRIWMRAAVYTLWDPEEVLL